MFDPATVLTLNGRADTTYIAQGCSGDDSLRAQVTIDGQSAPEAMLIDDDYVLDRGDLMVAVTDGVQYLFEMGGAIVLAVVSVSAVGGSVLGLLLWYSQFVADLTSPFIAAIGSIPVLGVVKDALEVIPGSVRAIPAQR